MKLFGKLTVGLALLALLVWFFAAHEQQIRVAISGRDSTIYWASGKLLSHGENPYSGPAVLALERSQGYTAEKPKILHPAAWSMWLVSPLGLLSACWGLGRMARDSASLTVAQMGIVLLLGVAIFLLLAESRPFQAGITLLLPMAKTLIFGALCRCSCGSSLGRNGPCWAEC